MALSRRHHCRDGLPRLGPGKENTEWKDADRERGGRGCDVFGKRLRADGQQDRSERQEHDGAARSNTGPFLPIARLTMWGNRACNR